MELSTEKVNDVLIIKILNQKLDASNALKFKKAIINEIKGYKKVLINMSEIDFIDSSGCGIILHVLKTLTSDKGDLKLFGLQKTVQVVIELIRMHQVIEIFNTKEEALKSYLNK